MTKKNSGKTVSQRQLKVGEEIRHSLSEIFLHEHFYDSSNNDISLTVSEVRVSPDLRNATAFVMPLAGKAPEGFIETLNQISPQFTHLVGKKVKLKYIPKIFFKIDSSFENASKIENLINLIKKE